MCYLECPHFSIVGSFSLHIRERTPTVLINTKIYVILQVRDLLAQQTPGITLEHLAHKVSIILTMRVSH